MVKLYVNEKEKKGHINPELYGHFSEHLGRCIYEGLYVGENSNIPNKNGIRTDVVEALKEIQIPVLPLAGWLFCGRISLEGRNRPKGNKKENGQHALGWCC